jgi:hypothetical protein
MSACPIKGVVRVKRVAVEPNVRAEAALLDEALPAVVALLAQALKLAEPELVEVTAMRFDVIADRRRHGQTLG